MFVRVLVVLGVSFLAAAGCKRGNSVSGEVTIDGKMVENGFIHFLTVSAPGNGPGDPHAAPGQIKDGKYRIDGLTPGKKIVRVTALGKMEIKEGPDKKVEAKTTPTATPVPENAIGNNEIHEILPGHHVLNIHLKSPEGTK